MNTTPPRLRRVRAVAAALSLIAAAALLAAALVAPAASSAEAAVSTDTGVVGSAPRVTIVAPAPDAWTPATVLISGEAADPDGIRRVDVAVQRTETREWARPDGTWGEFAWLPTELDRPTGAVTSWSTSWDASAAGYHVVIVRAVDAGGQADESDAWVRFTAGSPPGAVVSPPTPPVPAPWPSADAGVGRLDVVLHDPERGRTLPTTVLYPSRPGTSGPGAPVAADEARPLVVVGHGSAGDGAGAAESHRFLVEEGYVVAGPTFPRDGRFDWGAMAGDVSHVITRLSEPSAAGVGVLDGVIDAERIGYIGTSMGGMIGLATYQRCCLDPRIDAVVAKIAAAPWGRYDHASGPPLLMINGTDDTVIPYGWARSSFERAGRPKAMITLDGIGHGLRIPGSDLGQAAPLAFLDHYVRDDPGGLDRLRQAVADTPIASLDLWT